MEITISKNAFIGDFSCVVGISGKARSDRRLTRFKQNIYRSLCLVFVFTQIIKGASSIY